MEPTFYTRVELRSLDVDRVAQEYVDWLLGLHNHEKVRGRRLDAGVGARWFAKQILGGGTFDGEHDCRVEVRREPGQFLLRFVHRDDSPGSGVFWHSQARVTGRDKGVTLEHGTARSAPKDVVLEPIAAPPKLLACFLKLNGQDVRPKEFWAAEPIKLAPGDVEHFADYVLLDTERAVPFLLVAPTTDGQKYLVPPDELARRLLGLARVAVLPDDKATFTLSRFFEKMAMPRQFGCFDGAVKLYETRIMRTDTPYRHLLWRRQNLEAVPAESRTDWLAGEACARIVRRSTPVGFFRSIEQFDREERHRVVQRLLNERLAHAQTVAATVAGREQTIDELKATIGAREQSIAELKASLKAAQDDGERFCETNVKLEEELRAAQEGASDLQQKVAQQDLDLEQKSTHIDSLCAIIDQLKADKPNPNLEDALRGAFAAALRGDPTLEQSLQIVSALYPERVVVLPSAWSSARKSHDFKHRTQALDLLRGLASSYWDALASGKGDAGAKSVFGSSFAPTDNVTSKRARDLRTFTYRGKDYVMERHLKIGTKESDAATLRVHFEWIASEKRIVIGHCGRHLDHY